MTIVIAARPGQADVQAVVASRGLDYPSEKLETIVTRGRQPSAQRNAAIKAAQGDLIYFLDDDSKPYRDNLKRAVSHFSTPEVQMVGGPNLCPPEAPALEQVFAMVLASRLAFGPSRARYVPVGKVRSTNEKELILCNLLVRRSAILELGGFNEALYPNEENALMDQLQERGGKLIYDPGLFVFRRPRATLKSFAKMLMTYGRGRAEQFRVHPTLGSALNFVPPLFCLYLVAMLVTLAVFSWVGRILLAGFGVYLLGVLAQAAVLALGRPSEEAPALTRVSLLTRSMRSLAAAPLTVLTHVLYGAGFWRGLFTKLRAPGERPKTDVVLERIDQ